MINVDNKSNEISTPSQAAGIKIDVNIAENKKI